MMCNCIPKECVSQCQWVSVHVVPVFTHLLDLDLGILNGASLDELEGLLNSSLDEHDSLGIDRLCETDHLLRDELIFDLNEGLNGVVLLTEDQEDHLGTCEARDW